MEPQRKTSKQEAGSKKPANSRDSSDNDSGVEDQSSNSQSKDSFIVSDEYQQSYSDEDYSSKSKKKNKKKEKKQKKKKNKKKKGKRDSDESVLADDLELIEQGAQQRGLVRLKKNKEKPPKHDEDDDYQQQEEEDYADYEEGGDGFYQNAQRESYGESQQHSFDNNRYQQADMEDLIDQKIRKQYYAQTSDKQIIDMNLPQRQIVRYQNYAKIMQTSIENIQKQFEQEERSNQAKWIYQKFKQLSSLRQNLQFHEEAKFKQQIENVLIAIHREHLEIMYIYYYRKKIWSQTLNLQLLMKIQEFDQEWMTFKIESKALKDDITSVIPSFQQVPHSLINSLNSCTEISQLKYFKDYTNFIMTKRKPLGPKPEIKSMTIWQICETKIDAYIFDKEIFLTPQSLCQNLRNRNQQKKPKTPYVQPDKALRKILIDYQKQKYLKFKQAVQTKDIKDPKQIKQVQETLNKYAWKQCSKQLSLKQQQQFQQKEDHKRDWSHLILLKPEKRIFTLVDYLALEMYNYPQLRRVLKQKYYKKLLISTTPTIKGVHYIGIYNQFFPVKRIKDKLVSTMKKQLWILARQAEKQGLIKIQLKFQWLLSSQQKTNFQSDPVFAELSKYYFDLTSHSAGDSWNLLRKQVMLKLLAEHFHPSFKDEIKQDLTREGTRQVIQSCCIKFRNQLNKGPSLKQKQPIKILSMVLQQQKLGIAFVDEQGKQHSTLSVELKTDDELKRFVGDHSLKKIIDDHHPDMILVSANCRRAQTLRKELRTPSLSSQALYCGYGQYEVPNIMANKISIEKGNFNQKCILQAISMARLKKNPMAEILSLWSNNIEENGIYSMNLHPLQKFINKRKLIDSLQKVAIQIVNLVGVDIDDIRNSDHCRNILQFVCGLGPRKAFDFIERVKEKYPPMRKNLLDTVKSNYVYTNCSPFIKFERAEHLQILEKTKGQKTQQYRKQKHSKRSKQSNDRNEINLLDTTRIPEQWYSLTQRLFLQAIKASNFTQLKHKKNTYNLSDEQIAIKQMFKHPEKLMNVQWQSRKGENQFYDEMLIKSEITNSFKDPRDPEKVMENRDIFYNLLKETPDTLKKYNVVTVKILSVSQNKQFLNVVIPQNGLFGYIKLPNQRNNDKKQVTYQKGMYIKAVITGFPFDQRRNRDRQQGDQEQQLLKVDMALNFPHRSEDKNHDCHKICFPNILRQIHPNIDLDKQNFDLEKESLPIVQVRQQNAYVQRPKTEMKRISHPKFKSVNLQTAVEEVKQLKVGDFLIRPSTEGNNFLTITWHFYKGIVGHIKFKCQQRPQVGSVPTYRVLDKAQDKLYSSIDEIIQKYLKPMNNLVQDVISNKKFLGLPLDQIQQRIKSQANSTFIQYFFGCSAQYPQFFVLAYMYKDKKPIKQLIRVKSDGLHFHDQTFHNLRELISFFKQHLRDKKYQSYARSTAIKK